MPKKPILIEVNLERVELIIPGKNLKTLVTFLNYLLVAHTELG